MTFVGWVKPTMRSTGRLVGFTHPTKVIRPMSWIPSCLKFVPMSCCDPQTTATRRSEKIPLAIEIDAKWKKIPDF